MPEPNPSEPTLDQDAVTRWPMRLAAHALGLGLVGAVLLVLPQAPSDLDRFQLPKETAVHLSVWVAVLLARPSGGAALSRAFRLGLLLFVGASIASIAFATNPWLATRAVALTLSGVAALFTARHLARAGEGSLLLAWIAIAAGAGTATGLAQAYGADSPLFATTRAPGGTFGNRNFLAHFAVLALPALTYRLFTSRRTGVIVPTLVVAAACCTCIVLTRSRAAWLGAAAALGTMSLLAVLASRHGGLPRLGSRAMLLLGALAAGAVVAVTLPNALEWRSDSPYSDTLGGLVNTQEGSGRGRLLQYGNTLRLVARHPVLGVGPGNWPIRYGEVAPPNDPSWTRGDVIPLNPWPSSDWLAVLSERGVVAGIGLLLIVAALVRRAGRRVRQGSERTIAAVALVGLLAAIACVGALDAVMLLPAPMLLVTVTIGTLLAAMDDPVEALPLPSTSRFLSLALLLLGCIVVRSTLQTTAYIVAGRGTRVSRLTWAARLDPGSYPIRIALANRLPCGKARPHIRAVSRLAPAWPASRRAVRRCGG